MSGNYWLYTQLSQKPNLSISSRFHPVIIVEKDEVEYRIYTPNPEEYLIDVDVVQKAKSLGANIISYPSSWCRASNEAISYGRIHKIRVVSHSELFSMLD